MFVKCLKCLKSDFSAFSVGEIEMTRFATAESLKIE